MTQTTPPVRLDELIAAINAARPDDTLEQLSQAVLLGDRLGELADHLIGHFVDQARRSGASWTEIGRSMGVTKQAAQKRFVGRPAPADGFERFSAPARAAVVGSMAAANAAGHPEILPGHLLLGMLDAAGAVGTRALQDQGLEPGAVRTAAHAALPPAGEPTTGLLPYDARSRKVLELTFREALRRNHLGIGTGHLLLALMAEESLPVAADQEAVETFLREADPEPHP
ncbi:Clp protease N-terminal domain-containing protein [Paractinoplanes rishiriensis]|uniref:Clp R domain-containing protein n=1 Tax=Paractinoplanes rishiriensis TaxID=1050105 RepID=A0A919N267_9ACTN|nr:Clp protease N-terminal domain-containing protein [Actinoplanes rishiriensis]GIE98752.1 hypothetical protein Ari01nite_62170 [Actinoplanes rishiriensis]